MRMSHGNHFRPSHADIDVNWERRYVKPTYFARYSPLAWVRWAVGKPYPNGKDYKCEGYKIFEVGPKKLEGYGIDECVATRDRLLASDRGRCPFAFS